MAEYCKIDELLTNPYNRDIKREKVEAIKQAIKDSNEIKPLVYAEVDHDGKPAKMITDGHHRYHALKELGYTEVPIVMQDERGIETKAPAAEVEKKEAKKLDKNEAIEQIKLMAKSFNVKEDIKNIAKSYNTRVQQPNPSHAQANDQASIERMDAVYQDLIGMAQGLSELESLAIEQGLLTEEELAAIVIPLRDQIETLLSSMEGGEDFRELPVDDDTQVIDEETPEGEEDSEVEDTEEEETEEGEEEVDPKAKEEAPEEENPKNPQSRKEKKPKAGPKRQPGTGSAERELEAPAAKAVESTDLNKSIFGGSGSGRGFRGDPERHAEAARERWRQEGVPPGGRNRPAGGRRSYDPKTAPQERQPQAGGPAEAVLKVPQAIKGTLSKTAERAGRSFARVAGDTVAELGTQALGAVAGIMLYRYLGGQGTGIKDMVRLGRSGLKDSLKRSFQLRRIDSLSRRNKIANLVRAWAHKPD